MLRAENLLFAHPGGRSSYTFTFAAEGGQVTAIHGPSGSGKSTLLDLVAGFLTPTAGSLTLDTYDLLPLPPEERPVSILFQSETLFEHLSSAQNVALGLPPGGSASSSRDRVRAALAEVGLPGVERQRAGTLSGGQKQRVALARTLLRNRPVLLLDEPFSALDDEARAEARDLVLELTKRNSWHTVLVSHHGADVLAIAARAYRIGKGALVTD